MRIRLLFGYNKLTILACFNHASKWYSTARKGYVLAKLSQGAFHLMAGLVDHRR